MSTIDKELLQALRDLQERLHDTFKLDVRKHYSLMIADSMASKAIAKAEGSWPEQVRP